MKGIHFSDDVEVQLNAMYMYMHTCLHDYMLGLGDSTDSITITIVNSYHYCDINRYYYRDSIHVLF